jgi:hypothetical protein
MKKPQKVKQTKIRRSYSKRECDALHMEVLRVYDSCGWCSNKQSAAINSLLSYYDRNIPLTEKQIKFAADLRNQIKPTSSKRNDYGNERRK